MTDRIRILLIDDHTLFRDSLMRLLEQELDFEVTARCATVAEGYECLLAREVDVVLLDYDLGREVGADLLARLDEKTGKVRAILVTAGMGAGAIAQAVAAGVAGIVLKHSDPRHLMEAVRKVHGGASWWDDSILQKIAAHANGRAAAPARAITERQRQVLRSILDGLSNKEIAARMQASETSIKATIQELFSKAGVRTRSQLVRVAIERYSVEWLK
jgi:two-component system, NarL family, nitrate/nitrite response regulator NarL